ncbi:MAG TPA: hypothetical protein VGM93_11385, partial [Acidimicrobiales bacterium]
MKLAVVATPGTARRARPLLAVVARSVTVVALDRCDGRPDAVFASSLEAVGEVPAGVAYAVWVDAEADLSSPAAAGAALVLSQDAGAIAGGAIAVPTEGLDIAALPPLPPLTRARWRSRFGFPADLVVGIDPGADPAGDARTAVALAAVAVVHGPLLATALALATPVVTSPIEAARLGARPGIDVAVSPTEAAADALARETAADPDRVALMARRARAFAERQLDLRAPAEKLRRHLRLVEPSFPGSSVLDARL